MGHIEFEALDRIKNETVLMYDKGKLTKYTRGMNDIWQWCFYDALE